MCNPTIAGKLHLQATAVLISAMCKAHVKMQKWDDFISLHSAERQQRRWLRWRVKEAWPEWLRTEAILQEEVAASQSCSGFVFCWTFSQPHQTDMWVSVQTGNTVVYSANNWLGTSPWLSDSQQQVASSIPILHSDTSHLVFIFLWFLTRLPQSRMKLC